MRLSQAFHVRQASVCVVLLFSELSYMRKSDQSPQNDILSVGSCFVMGFEFAEYTTACDDVLL